MGLTYQSHHAYVSHMPTPSVTVSVRCPVDEYERLERLAEAVGLGVSTYLRRAGLGTLGQPAGEIVRAPESRSSDPGWKEKVRRSPVAPTPVAKGGMHANRSIDTAPSPEQIVAESSVPLSAKPNGREAIVADLRAKVEAVGKGLQGSGTTLSDEPEVLDSNCAHPKAKVVQGASGVAVKVCPDCGERGL